MKEEVLENFHQNIQISATHEEPIMPTKLYFNKHCPNEFVQYLYPEIFLLEPFGQRFEQPIFLSPPLQIERLETFGANKNHLRLYLPTNECFYLFNSNSDNHHFTNNLINISIHPRWLNQMSLSFMEFIDNLEISS